MSTYRPPRGAWKNLPPGSIPESFRDLEDANAYYDSLALTEYTTSTQRQFILQLARRQPTQIRAISLEKLLWLLPGLGGATTLSKKGEKEKDESLGQVARTVLVQCAGYKPLERNHASIDALLTARNTDPLCVFLVKLLEVPNEPLSETACAVLLSVVQAPGRSCMRDLSAMDMGDLTRLLLVRIYRVFQTSNHHHHTSPLQRRREGKEGGSPDKPDADYTKWDPHSGLLRMAHTQGFQMLRLLFELTQVPKALPWLRHGIVQLVPALLDALVPDGAHGTLPNMLDSRTGLLKTTVSATYSKACRDLDSFETLCSIVTQMSTDNATAKLMVHAEFVQTWFWMLRERRQVNDGKGYGEDQHRSETGRTGSGSGSGSGSGRATGLDGHLEDDEHQRRVVRSFFDVLWEWTDSSILMPHVQTVLIQAMERGQGNGRVREGAEDDKETHCSWVEDECDVLVRRLHPSSDLAMHACGILWNCLSNKKDVMELETYILERGIVEKVSNIMLNSQDCGVLTCCAGALYNLVQVRASKNWVDLLLWLSREVADVSLSFFLFFFCE